MSATHGRRARRADRNARRDSRAATAENAVADEIDMPTTADSAKPNEGTTVRRTRAGLPMRIALGTLAAIAAAAALIAAVNLRAATTFNQATQSLTEHIAAAKADTPDWSKLNALQEQTDAQFDEAAAASAVLLPGIREAIAANAAVSDKLTALVKRNLDAQQGGSTSSGSGDSSSGGNDQEQSSDSSSGALTDEQRKQVEDLLKANEQSTPSGKSTSKESTVTNNTGNTNKPW
ncbi:DUF6466 family protein [Bifidobacterium biavatii]|uniref:Cell surface protein n=1 Tax=Bifidobacterium biavatii DSM 23969 TaxID=1437608 RepID=A0A087A1W1_9BIFI|nr:DUF6466 family protein [Bifidobacterium biavatii]KFI52761.1 cell surface protein [Bifidobacterium biavatii DSM 23969]